MNAASISRHLHSVGFRPLPSGTPVTREGLRVKQSGLGRVRVVADLDSERAARDLAIAARQALVAAGYAVEPHGDGAFYVTRRA